MKEFQAENDRRLLMNENSLSALINATADHENPSLTISDQSEKLVDNTDTLERRSNADRSKLNVKAIRFTSDTLKVRLEFHLKLLKFFSSVML
jgi:hypothetical protein